MAGISVPALTQRIRRWMEQDTQGEREPFSPFYVPLRLPKDADTPGRFWTVREMEKTAKWDISKATTTWIDMYRWIGTWTGKKASRPR
jgi:hypothetical protein